MKFIQMELIAGRGSGILCREALPGTRMWAALPAESVEQRESLGGRKGYKDIMGGEGLQLPSAKSQLCFQREGTGLRTILLATNNLKNHTEQPSGKGDSEPW